MPNLALAASALTDMAQILGITEKSVASVARRFQADMRSLAVIGFTGTSSILSDMRGIVKSAVADAYVEGLKSGGVSFDEMSDDDATMIIELGDAQLAFVTDFVKAIREARSDKALQRDILNTRIPMWVASIETAGGYGLASAKADSMGTWRYGKTEHCDTCQALNGQRKRLKTWIRQGLIPQQPGNELLDCRGYNCQCEIRDDRGRVLLPA